MSSSFSFLPATNPSASVSSPTSVFYPVSLCLTVSSCPNLYFPISLFLCFSLFYSECHQRQEIKTTTTTSWKSIYTHTPFHVVLASELCLFCFSSSRLIRPILCLISTQPLCSVNPAMSLSVPNNTLITSFQEHDKVRFFTTMTLFAWVLNQSKALLKAGQTPELHAFA